MCVDALLVSAVESLDGHRQPQPHFHLARFGERPLELGDLVASPSSASPICAAALTARVDALRVSAYLAAPRRTRGAMLGVAHRLRVAAGAT